LHPLAILVNSPLPYIARGLFLISGLIVVFERFFKKETPLSGAPAVRRMKTYSAQSGYVYQYCYEGQRPLPRAGESGIEFVFALSSDRKTWSNTRVLVPDQALSNWEIAHERGLSATERYAIAKLALFQAFDERETPALVKADILVRSADVEAIIDTLGL
jgi:hypothetical protein